MSPAQEDRSAPAGPEVVLEARGVRKVFKTFERAPGLLGVLKNFVARDHVEIAALTGVDLRVERGESVGLIGANGAGKTTLVKILAGIVPASAGEARLLGRDSFHLQDAEKRRLALVMGQKSQLWWDLPAIDSFQLLKEIYGVSDAHFNERLARFAALLEVEDRLKIQLRQLSLGQRMKMEIIGAFLHSPEVVFLDEPTIGLDLISRETIRRFLIRLADERSVTFVLTSHDMEDIEETCRRIVVLDQGAVAFDGGLMDLSRRVTGQRAVEVHVNPHSSVDEAAVKAELARHGAELAGRSAGSLTVIVGAERLAELVPRLFAVLDVRDLSVERQPLEHLIREIYRRGAAGAAGGAE